MSNPADSIQAKMSAVLGAVLGAIILPLIGFALDGYHSLADYVKSEKMSVIVLLGIGAVIGMFLGRMYGTIIAKGKEEGDSRGREQR